MNGDVLVFAQVMTIIVASTGAFVAIGLGARMLWRAGSRVRSRALPPVDDTRMDRLEAAVDAIAIEVERISESQRYTVSLLSERLPAQSDAVGELQAGSSLTPERRVGTLNLLSELGTTLTMQRRLGYQPGVKRDDGAGASA